MSDTVILAILAAIPIIIAALVTAIVKLAGIRKILDRPRQYRRDDDHCPNCCDRKTECEHHPGKLRSRATTKK